MEQTPGNNDVLTDRQQASLLTDFFAQELRHMYGAENRLVKALAVMEEQATTEELKEAFENHRLETEEHVERLESVFEMTGISAEPERCEAMEGIFREAEDIVASTERGSMTRDAGLIVAAQKAEHYEMASYGSLVTLARTLGMPDVAEVLAQTLQEEKAADAVLSGIAGSQINITASDEER